MTAFAGIIRHDRQPVPKDWMCSLTGHTSKRIHDAFLDQSTAFVRFEHGAADSSAGAECMEDAGCILLAEARIDNREELGDCLGLHAGSGVPDVTLVALAYKRWGEDSVKRLIGEFALMVWHPARRRLFMARDILGARTIYYHVSSSLFVFATELRTLLTLPFVPHDVNEGTIADFLCGDGSGPGGTTFYEAIQVLPNAHTLVLDEKHLSRAPYWIPAARPIPALKTDEDYARELRERITAAVECRLRGGKNIAVHLSGGLDSSAVACIAARSLKKEGRRLLALCSMLPNGYTGPESDERPFVEAVLAQEDNIDAVWVEPPLDKDPFGALTRWFETLGQPSYSNVTHIEEMLGAAGLTRGADVVLSGFGGDLFASCPGHNSIRELLISARWRLAISELRALHREQGMGWITLLKHEILGPFLRSHLHTGRLQGKRRTAAHRELINRVHERRGRRPRPWGIPSLSTPELMRFLLAPGHLEQPVSSIVQVFARQFSQELRFPLLDVRVIELMLGMPIEQFRKDGWPRGLMRRAMKGILPEIIRRRRDKGGAFDPAITSRVVAARASLEKWAVAVEGGSCWKHVDRACFMDALSAVERSSRAQWKPEFFRIVLAGGIVAHFIHWHEHAGDRACI